MSVITLSATLPSEFVSTASVGTSADWLVIQKSGENYLRKIPASASAFGAAALAGSSSQNFACTTLTCSAAGAIILPNTASIWCSGNQRGIQFNNSDTTIYGGELKAYNVTSGAFAPITAASIYCVTGGIKVNGHITADDRATYDLGSPAEAFNELYLAADSSSMGKYDHTAIYTSADGFKIRTASGSGSSWSFTTTLKPLFSSDSGHTSNRRLKTDVGRLTGARAHLRATAPSSFRMIGDGPGGRTRWGFIAEELETVMPTAVMPIGDHFEEDGEPVKAVLIMPLVAFAIQCLREHDEALETIASAFQKERAARLALEARIAALE